MAQVEFDLNGNCETFKAWLEEHKVAHTYEHFRFKQGGVFFCEEYKYTSAQIEHMAKKIKLGEINRSNVTDEARKKSYFHRGLIYLRKDVLQEEWGSEKQIACQTLFFDICKYLGYDWVNDEEWHLKATLDESVERALDELYPY